MKKNNKKEQKQIRHKPKTKNINTRSFPLPKWLVSAVIYGLSWSMLTPLNLSFLAWFAFIPLFIDLEERNTFRQFYSRGLYFSSVAYFIICHGFLFSAGLHLLVFLGSVSELIMTSIPFAIIYPLKKRYGFTNAVWTFPLIFVLWEWIYQNLEFTTGYLMLSHSQASNILFIQFIDVFGVYAIGFWVMLFNVLIYFLYKKYSGNIKLPGFRKGLVFIIAVMTIPPLGYYFYKDYQQNNTISKKIKVSLINSSYHVNEATPETSVKKIEQFTYLTDSLDYDLKLKGTNADLYVWSEGALEYGNETILSEFIFTAVNDWNTPLLLGEIFFPQDSALSNIRPVNRSVLFTPNSDSIFNQQYHDKIKLFPGREMIPYAELLSKIPFLGIENYGKKTFREGDGIRLISLPIDGNDIVKIGTPICQEQNYSSVWKDMALDGAECFVQLSHEAWWSTSYFLEQMANITRLRCIETRRSCARCSNGGVTAFYDQMGRQYSAADVGEGAPLNYLTVTNSEVSIYSRNSNLLLIFSAVSILLFISFNEFKNIKYRKVTLGNRIIT